jgi:hypothetical protein
VLDGNAGTALDAKKRDMFVTGRASETAHLPPSALLRLQQRCPTSLEGNGRRFQFRQPTIGRASLIEELQRTMATLQLA